MTVESRSNWLERRTSDYRLDIQALRGLAVLLVVLYHADLGFSGGFVGVDAFFVISGYVIAGTLLRELDRSGTIKLSRFYARRILRLMPALALLSVFALAASVIFLPFALQPLAAHTAIAANLLGSNVYLYLFSGGYFDASAETNPFLHTWSLSVEEQFYFVLPTAMILLWMIASRLTGLRPRSLAGGMFAVLSVTSLFLSRQTTNGKTFFLAGIFGSPERFAFYIPATRVWEFLTGVLLALYPLAIARWTAFAMRGAGLTALLVAALTFDQQTSFPGISAGLPVLGTALVIAAGSRSLAAAPSPLLPTFVRRAWDGLVWIGDLSYSWYLWHWPFIVLTDAVWAGEQLVSAVAAFISLGPAWISKRWVEDPIRFRPAQNRVAVGLVAFSCLLVPTAAGIVVHKGANAGWGVTMPAGLNDLPLGRGTLGCHSTGTSTWPVDQCTVRANESRGLILLLGDSHAASASDGVAEAAARLQMDFGVWSESGCPLLFERAPHDLPTCRSWQARALGAIAEHRPTAVVIANRSSYYTRLFNEDRHRTLETRSSQQATNEAEALASWAEGLEGLLDRITGGDSPPYVMLLANVPEYPSEENFNFSLLNQPQLPPTVERIDLDEQRKVVEIEKNIVGKFPKVELFDPVDVLCEPSQCSARDDSEWWYYDTHHLNSRGSLRLANAITDRLRGALLAS